MPICSLVDNSVLSNNIVNLIDIVNILSSTLNHCQCKK